MNTFRSTLIFFAITLLCVFATPSSLVKGFQSKVSKSNIAPLVRRSEEQDHELEKLKFENVKLLQLVVELMESPAKLDETVQARDSEFYQRRLQDFIKRYSLSAQKVLAPVVQRDYSSWSSHLWIGVGEKTNQSLGKPIIAVDSPVVINQKVVGIVEKVEVNRSLVRLITSPKLSLSVRAARGIDEELFALEKLTSTLEYFSLSQTLKAKEACEPFLEAGERLKQSLAKKCDGVHLAKGEIHGHAFAKGRKLSSTLAGEGFNYDYSDEEGPARELKTGSLLDDPSSTVGVPLLKKGDLLVTTGMDGVFPPGLFAAYVEKVYPIAEGDSSFSLEARACSDLDEVSFVEVLPPWQTKNL